VYRRRMRKLLFNFLCIQTLSFALSQGYVKPLMYFGFPLDRRALFIFMGAFVMLLINRSFSLATALFFDLHYQRHIWFQRQSVPLFILYGTKLLFSVVFMWVFLIPLLPASKIVLGTYFPVAVIRWPLFLCVLFLVVCLIVSYAFMMMCAVRSLYGLIKVRVRLNEVLVWLGGFNVTWLAMYKSWKGWGYVALANPFTYATEALRQTVSPGQDLLPLFLTIPALIMWSLLFVWIGYGYFARKNCR